MRKLLALSLATAAACGGGALKDQARDALPDKSGLQMGPQQAQAPAQPGQTPQNASSVDAWYALTVAYSFSINAGIAWTLAVVEAITDFEPTSCTADSCTWGPGSNALDPNTYQLVVTKTANGSFDWKLEARSKMALPSVPFSKIIFGNAVPSGQLRGGVQIDGEGAAAHVGGSVLQGRRCCR